MRKAREARAKDEAEFVDRARAWAKSKEKGEAEISRIADKAREKAEFEARVRKNDNAVNKATTEAAARIRFSEKIQGAKIEKAEAESRKKVEAEMKEKAEKTRKSREAKTKADTETMERERAWSEAL